MVMLKVGIVEGVHFGSGQTGVAFLGVPYAAPPVGDLRWKPPQSVRPWTGMRRAMKFGAACPQLPAGWLPYIGWNEDCLYLNVWTTHLYVGPRLPVIVYFHGGSNTTGYSQLDPLGPALSRLGVVVVSANYRLGPMGFFAHPALTAESPHHSSGNYGLLDQLEVLKWVRENISRLGGDPNRITVMGQSAGSVDICLLMASPMSAGLFQRAIMESGDCQSVLDEDIRTPLPYNFIAGTGEGAGERLAGDLGVANGPEALRKLRSIPVTEILKSWSQDRQVHFDAIVDGWVLPEQPAKIYAEGKELQIPVLVGSNADEATVFGHNDVKTVDQYKQYLLNDTGKYTDQEFQAYPVATDADVPEQYLRIQNDTFAYGARSMARAMTSAGRKAYLYCVTFSETGKRTHLGAYHGEELRFLSDSFPSDWEHSDDDKMLGNLMRTYWTQFARTGDPNAPGLPAWTRYDAHSDQCLELGRMIGVRPVAPQLKIIENIMKQVFATTATMSLSSEAKTSDREALAEN
ncbi:carboxylesterase/lipase family protein [Edaphobacter aggregans]|nr:carboxylesterase family protein [Edaphobacter aggregans]